MTIETFGHDRPGFDASEFTDGRTDFSTDLSDAGGIGSTDHRFPADEDELEALCRNALARFADALRKAVLD